MSINQDRVLAEFAALVAIDSPSLGERKMGDYLRQRLGDLGLQVSEDDAGQCLGGNCGNLYGYLAGSLEGPPLLFCGHMDTVEPGSGKQAIVGPDGVIRSNGQTILGADDCAGLAAILEALQTIQAQGLPHRPVEVLLTVAEEIYCKGAKLFDYSLIQAREAYVLDLTGPVGGAAYKAPTILSFAVTVKGRAAHAGFAPEDGIHAIAAAAWAISQLNMGRVDPDTTLNIGLIEGGRATNIVPEQCLVRGEIRSYSHGKALEQMEKVRLAFAEVARTSGVTIDLATVVNCEAYETPLDHRVVERYQAACQQLGLPVALQPTFGGSDNNVLASHGIAGLVIANAMNQCHSCGEFTTVDELGRIAELTLALMASPA